MTHHIKVGAMTKAVTAYDKDYDIEIDGVEMRVILHWDDKDGYELTWLDKEDRFITSPDWIAEHDNFCRKLDDTDPHTIWKIL